VAFSKGQEDAVLFLAIRENMALDKRRREVFGLKRIDRI
jgi:hypothetical protein